jgi:hypothetical protein
MGMYTEFHYNAKLSVDTPDVVIDILKRMLGQPYDKTATCDHGLFRTERWEFMLRGDSYYFDADTHSTLRFDTVIESYVLCIRCNFKNYDNEIGLFVDWMSQYIDKQPGEFLGFYRYEEDRQPTLLYAEGL